MQLRAERKGEFYIGAGAVLWGLFPVITILSYASLPPLMSLAASTFFSALFFIGLVTVWGKWHELRNTRALGDILWTTFFIGIIFYTFFFLGLRYTSAGNASIISLTETFFSYLLFQVWHKEHIPRAHIAGAVLMVLGAAIVLWPNVSGIRIGDLLILIGSAIAPLGNFFQRRARTIVSSETIMCVRAIVVVPVVLVMALVAGEQVSFAQVRASLPFLVVNGVLLFGLSKIFWIEGIHRIGVTKANALSSFSPLFTILFAWLFLHNIPTPWQLFSLIPLAIGTILLSYSK